jgi:hypothetical protein
MFRIRNILAIYGVCPPIGSKEKKTVSTYYYRVIVVEAKQAGNAETELGKPSRKNHRTTRFRLWIVYA